MEHITIQEDQWLLDGICSRCRKNAYCSKYCKKAEMRRNGEIASFIAERPHGTMLVDLECPPVS